MANSESLEALGERMFNDIRFSQYFKKVSRGNVNYNFNGEDGSPELETIVIRGQEHDSPFSGQASSCASCHMVDQAFDLSPGGMRGYNDFSSRTKVPLRGDSNTHTLRNTPTLVGIGSKYAQNRFSHFDGEFHDHSQTVLGNFSGRNMGWLKKEKKVALKNIVNIIKEDNGLSELAVEFGGSYQKIFLGVDPSIPEEFRIPQEHSLDVLSASDEQIIEKVVFYVTAYMDGIDFEKNEKGIYSGSVYDEFLRLNNIPAEPREKQSIAQYSAELIQTFIKLKTPKFVAKRYFPNHNREIGFNQSEWDGLRTFFNIGENKAFARGMCVNCHMPPLFTDQQFHNIGVVQFEYDEVHTMGDFAKLKLPKLHDRKDLFFLDRPIKEDKSKVDLGVWNFFGRDDKQVLTSYLMELFCNNSRCEKEELLPHLVGRFKTPTLRNLGHSEPYFHNGKKKNLDEVLSHYLEASNLMKLNELKNGAPQLRMMNINPNHSKNLKAFLFSLNENYE